MQSNKIDSSANPKAYNGVDRNAFIFGFNPQAELWNGRLAMIGFLAYLLWDLSGVSVVRDLLHLVSY
jgi:Chlorophyll A-B binding protein